MNPLSEFRSLFANSKKERSTKRKKYKKVESFKLCNTYDCMYEIIVFMDNIFTRPILPDGPSL